MPLGARAPRARRVQMKRKQCARDCVCGRCVAAIGVHDGGTGALAKALESGRCELTSLDMSGESSLVFSVYVGALSASCTLGCLTLCACDCGRLECVSK